MIPFKTCKKGIHQYDANRPCCPVCKLAGTRIYKKKWHAARVSAHKERTRLENRRNNLRIKYGITIERYDAMFVAQSGCCAICKAPQSALSRRLAVDHNHDTGKIRALLCGECNSGLGKFKDNQELLRAAAAYLHSHDFMEQITKVTKMVALDPIS